MKEDSTQTMREQGWGCSSEVGQLPNIHKTPGSIQKEDKSGGGERQEKYRKPLIQI
jgi:hypothetical protein